ncbi:MAG: type II toxin-antitoxin system RelE/ParE family toxin [Verrucomicrobiales bacterium]|nr:type II toxin-antitoxin system RelE/ParE family toxin [Verrucomicrobiales bacterium]
MKIDEVIWTSGATSDLQEIYGNLDWEKADDLVLRVDASLDLLKAFPERAGRYKSSKVRRLLVGRRNQYGLFYTITGRRIIIAAFVELGGDPELLERLIRSRTNS